MLEVKSSIRKLSIAGAEALAAQVLELGSVADVESLLKRPRAET
jgi:phosphoenolpyruvate-protein kinase (PTS system EI component)